MRTRAGRPPRRNRGEELRVIHWSWIGTLVLSAWTAPVLSAQQVPVLDRGTSLLVGGSSTLEEQVILTPDVPVDFAVFGADAAIDGTTAIVGAPFIQQLASTPGSATVFVLSGGEWVMQQELVAAGVTDVNAFGIAVAIDANVAVVGATLAQEGVGAVYVFRRSGTSWAQEQVLVPESASDGDEVGISVAVDADTIVFGARGDDEVDSGAGAAYVYVRNGGTWEFQQKLLPSGTTGDDENDEFGTSVDIFGNTVVVGSPTDDEAGLDAGSAFVFVREAGVWSEQQQLLPNDSAAFDCFGEDAGIWGETVVVGSNFGEGDTENSGSAYIFTRTGSTWSQQAELLASDPAPLDLFGNAVDICGDTVVVGARQDNIQRGSCYVFTRDIKKWMESAKLTASDSEFRDQLGSSVAVSGETVLVGAQGDDEGGTDRGSAYIFAPPPPKAREPRSDRSPGSLLLFPEFDNRDGMVSLLTVTNTNPNEAINVHFVYIGRFGADQDDNPVDLACEEFDRTHFLTPNETLTFIANNENPQQEQGFMYAYARAVGGINQNLAVGFDHLIGHQLTMNGFLNLQYSINSSIFHAAVEEGARTDLDDGGMGDGVRDLDGIEYELAPAQILIPRFLAQDDRFDSELILIGLSGGSLYNTTADLWIYNDDEDAFSTMHTFRCWTKVSLLDISSLFHNQWLKTYSTDNENKDLDHDESEDTEYGWFRLNGRTASSTFCSFVDPTIYAVYIEVMGDSAAADLPFESMTDAPFVPIRHSNGQDGHLLPRLPGGDNSEEGCPF